MKKLNYADLKAILEVDEIDLIKIDINCNKKLNNAKNDIERIKIIEDGIKEKERTQYLLDKQKELGEDNILKMINDLEYQGFKKVINKNL